MLPDKECTDPVHYAVIKFNIQTLNIPQSYLQTMYDLFVHRTSEEDFCIIAHDTDTFSSIVNSVVTEYESSAQMHMLAVQADIYRLLIAIARKTGTKKTTGMSGLIKRRICWSIQIWISIISHRRPVSMTAAILSGSTKAGVASHQSRSGNSLSPDSFQNSCHGSV